MDFNGYFDPVSLDRPEYNFLPQEETFSHNISVNTPDHPIRDLNKHHAVIIGVPQDEKAFLKGSKEAPDEIRSKLYQLKKINDNIRIYDLGNLKTSGSINDTYFALRDLILEFMERNMVSIILGGSQDLSKGIFLAFEKDPSLKSILTIDSRLDFSKGKEVPDSRNYLNHIISEKMRKIFNYANIGHQSYFVTGWQVEKLENSYLESIRLGDARSKLDNTEPLIRDSSFLSIDMGCVRQSDAPGVSIPSPNGFTGEELCRMSRYAGLSEKVKVMGLFEMTPPADINRQTAHLAAQCIWYFLEGMTHRIRENPVDTPEHTRKFIVKLNAAGHDIIFHKSLLSERWWMEVPVINPATGYNFFVSCSYEDYTQACNQEIPDRWWRYLHRLSNEEG
ncbi:MAG: formimidoylglutamase [Bacteroidales bacterium]|nr:formimidoylglutamase [Bacteroidales bacterium]MBN2698544.1 formimidoylglutamase [Bacteroidales bacterium]